MDAQSRLLIAAHVIRLLIDPSTRRLSWDGFTAPMLEVCEGDLPQDWSSFLQRVQPSCREALLRAAAGSAEEEGTLDFCTSADWSMSYHFSRECPGELFVTCRKLASLAADELSTLRARNTQLLNKAAQAHHRVKNTLQNIISYINLLLAQSGVISNSDAAKLVRHINSLTSLHDGLLEELAVTRDGGGVRLDRLLGDVLSISSSDKELEWGVFPECCTSPSRAATVSLILNELLDHAARVGTGVISVRLLSQSNVEVLLEVAGRWSGSPKEEAEESSADTSLRLVQVLIKSAFRSDLKVVRSVEGFQLLLMIPVDLLSV